jgi:hypothetical protein
MPTRETVVTPVHGRPGYCADCGARLDEDVPAAERFGERFCSEAHAARFVAGVRSARMTEIAARETAPASCAVTAGHTWTDRVKRAACWGGPLLLLLAIPLVWSGNALAAAGGSLLSVLAVLACPVGMYFMMRAMMPARGKKHPGDE